MVLRRNWSVVLSWVCNAATCARDSWLYGSAKREARAKARSVCELLPMESGALPCLARPTRTFPPGWRKTTSTLKPLSDLSLASRTYCFAEAGVPATVGPSNLLPCHGQYFQLASTLSFPTGQYFCGESEVRGNLQVYELVG